MSSVNASADEPILSLEGIPGELRERSQWVCWTIDDDGKEMAINPLSGESLDSLDEAASFGEAQREYENSGHDGVAFVTRSDDDYVGIRLCDSVEELSGAPSVEEWTFSITDALESYTEAGPFGDDMLVIVKDDVPDDEYRSEDVQFTSKGIIPMTGEMMGVYNTIQHRPDEVESIFHKYNQYDPVADDDVTLADVRETVVKNFDEAQWQLTEAILSTHATLFIDGIQNCTGLIVVGDSGAGKTTSLSFFDGLDEQFYRSDEVTPASFVSHDASLSDEQLEEIDLLPRIQHKSLLCRDMETWFSGDREGIRSTMSRMTHLMDGDGLTRDSGSHGKRGYEGDLRFSFVGASTPLSPRAWEVMGNAGYRFVFYHKPRRDDDAETLKKNLFGESTYSKKCRQCRNIVRRFLQKQWHQYDGYAGIPDDEIEVEDAAQDAIAYLAKVVKFCRATIGDDDTPTREDPHRVGAVLRDIAKGRVLIDNRQSVTVDDVDVVSRIALSTMPAKRRPLVRALLDPANDQSLSTSEATEALGTSKPTAIDRMELLEKLEIAEVTEVEGDGRGAKRLELDDEFRWPESMSFPEE